ncbi:hypothetical protein C8K30_103261 [Promicromonospora sp. AC04]|uniref:hypothetical protein n=1 Tax=Promicromonospora sp. AC04 TaxID=2135723 RepID=UPI000D3A096C|nr:hypothetical protein [Promicromonospora sp. AC04]PUB28837.1 hypothetical protein C8K30_103261 [Promicromonospora sp. AC04]
MNVETAEQPVVDPARARVQVVRDTDAEFAAFVGSAGPYARRILMNLRIDGWRKDRRACVTDEGVVPLPVTALDVSAGTVAWSTEDGSAYAMVDRDGAPGVVRLAREQAAVGIDGDRIAWTTLGNNGVASTTFARVHW